MLSQLFYVLFMVHEFTSDNNSTDENGNIFRRKFPSLAQTETDFRLRKPISSCFLIVKTNNVGMRSTRALKVANYEF
jgi:hypothetical protein